MNYLVEQLRNRLFAFDDKTIEVIKHGKTEGWRFYYRNNVSFLYVSERRNKLVVFIKAQPTELDDPRQVADWFRHYGLMESTFDVHDNDEIKYAMSLIKQAYYLDKGRKYSAFTTDNSWIVKKGEISG